MLSLYLKAKDALHRLHTREEGQDTFEYLLIIGGVSVAIVLAIGLLGAPGVVGDVEALIDGVLNPL